MTESIAECARRYARSETEIVAVNPEKGPVSIEGYFDEIIAACGVLGYEFVLPEAPIIHRFSLEGGAELLGQVFDDVTCHPLASKLVFPTAEPALAYIQSMRSVYEDQLPAGLGWDPLMIQVETQVRQVIEQDGSYIVPKTTGLLMAGMAT